MTKEEALKVFTEIDKKLKANPTLSIPGSYVQAKAVLKEAGIVLPGTEQALVVEEVKEEILEESTKESLDIPETEE